MASRDTLLFDINETTLDLAPLRPKFEAAFGDAGHARLWFATLLHSSTVCALTQVRTGFAELAGAMLDSLAARLGVTLSETARGNILATFASLPAHSDMVPALKTLRAAGYRTVAFSNSSEQLVHQQIDNAGLSPYFDSVISVQGAGSFKPDPKAYLHAARTLNRPPAALRLIATHDWDTHGAISAGLKAGYIDRSGTPYHPLYHRPDAVADTMTALVAQIRALDGRE
ncbi:haloacid dehalogenase type II [Ferrimonas balearica]|uniref:haloacid dehalogenase type II n=1 Tax=Ferrimonas balearica TaxID=44012 RepID=UPI001C99B97C|nr:haloacid dehalogenase type II [Ferrimonas balearica]MBY5991158.1 haloacid dehalogenase type II [Ferrimonas balearica]